MRMRMRMRIEIEVLAMYGKLNIMQEELIKMRSMDMLVYCAL